MPLRLRAARGGREGSWVVNVLFTAGGVARLRPAPGGSSGSRRGRGGPDAVGRADGQEKRLELGLTLRPRFAVVMAFLLTSFSSI